MTTTPPMTAPFAPRTGLARDRPHQRDLRRRERPAIPVPDLEHLDRLHRTRHVGGHAGELARRVVDLEDPATAIGDDHAFLHEVEDRELLGRDPLGTAARGAAGGGVAPEDHHALYASIPTLGRLH